MFLTVTPWGLSVGQIRQEQINQVEGAGQFLTIGHCNRRQIPVC
jgi:hypothetical protein